MTSEQLRLHGTFGDFRVFESVVEDDAMRFEVRGPSPFVSSKFGSLREAMDAARRFAAEQAK